ncbi:MAG: hypothetical protein KDC03_04215 [Flavobacteriales bacterium]|nr:hypothetical protein [Flavobacteriales bacterium]
MSRPFLGVSACLLISAHLMAQTPGDSLYLSFDDATDDLVLDSIYPAGCWQVGTPSKPVFSGAFSPGRALVTDTLLPYPDSSVTCYAEFTLVATAPNYLGRGIRYMQRRDMDSTTVASIEVRYPWGTWDPFYVGFEQEVVVDGVPHPHDGTGVHWTGASSGWEEVVLLSGCYYVIWDPGNDGAEWYADTMHVRFAFTSSGNPDARDGWMIDDLRAGVSPCTGGLEEAADRDLLLVPNPAKDRVELDLSGPFSWAAWSSDGRSQASGRVTGVDPVLDVSQWPSGSYVLLVQQGGTTHRTRLYVVH